MPWASTTVAGGSATEARAVINGASARMRMLAEMIWTGGLEPVGRQIMLNARQSMSQETFARRVGIGKVMQYPLFHQPPAAIVANSDHFIMNGTLPSEKSFMAQSLQELLGHCPPVAGGRRHVQPRPQQADARNL